jgi:hypothetical protein
MTADHDDPLANLRARIRDTQEAAARLAEEAESARAQDVPPAGWSDPADRAERATEVQALVALLESLRDLIPDDLREQFRELVRQVLLLARALIDWWVERMDAPAGDGSGPPAGRGPVVEDIPIA